MFNAKAFTELIAILEGQATTIEVVCTVVGFLLGGAAGWSGATAARAVPGGAAYAGAVVSLAGGLIGYLVGRSKSFVIRLRVQELACLAAIEANTRR